MTRHYSRTFTVTIATPGVFTLVDHGLEPGDTIVLTTSGALPTGLTASTYQSETKYYVVRNGITKDTFQVSANKNSENNATSVVTSGSQSGTHKLLKVNHDGLTPSYQDNK